MIAMNPGSLFASRQFRVIKQIGAGGMGAVFEAEQLSTRKHRALKVLTQRFGTDEKAQTRFVREATVGADIDSAHVVDVIGAGIDEESGLPWLAMELLEVSVQRLGHDPRARQTARQIPDGCLEVAKHQRRLVRVSREHPGERIELLVGLDDDNGLLDLGLLSLIHI